LKHLTTRFLLFFGILLLDQATKLWIKPGTRIPLLGDWLQIHYVQNKGIAFGLLGHGPAFLLPLTLIATLLIAYLLYRTPPEERWWAWTLSLLLGGAAGNLIDRVRFGYVVDFLELSFWPTFNVADMAVSAGMAMLVFRWLFHKEARHWADRRQEAHNAVDLSKESSE